MAVLMLKRWTKVALVGVASWLIVCTLDDIAALYMNRMTPFAESVFSATVDLQRKMLALEGVRDADVVVKTFGGEFSRRFPSRGACAWIKAKREMSGIGSWAEDMSGYKVYDLPPIEDYRGYLVLRFSLDGGLQDYLVAYDGGANE